VRDGVLFAAYWSDNRGAQFENWLRCEGKLWRADDFGGGRMPKDFEDVAVRVRPFGMHNILKDAFDAGASEAELVELAARAFAMRSVEILLPNLSFLTRGYVVPEPDAAAMRWGQELVEEAMRSKFADYQDPGAWNGDDWEIELANAEHGRTEVLRYKWDWQKYQIELVEFCRHVFDKRRWNEDVPVDQWREPSNEERLMMETGLEAPVLEVVSDEHRAMFRAKRGVEEEREHYEKGLIENAREHARAMAEFERKVRECRQECVRLVFENRLSRLEKKPWSELTLRPD
jgi:hypothetical protein